MRLTLKSLDTKMQGQFAEVRAEMRRQFDEVHQRIDTLHFKIDAVDEKIDAKLDARFAQFEENLEAKLDARFSKFTADVIEGLSPWMNYMSTTSDDHKTRITTIERSEVI